MCKACNFKSTGGQLGEWKLEAARKMMYAPKEACVAIRIQENWASYPSFLLTLGLELLNQQGMGSERCWENTPQERQSTHSMLYYWGIIVAVNFAYLYLYYLRDFSYSWGGFIMLRSCRKHLGRQPQVIEKLFPLSLCLLLPQVEAKLGSPRSR